MIVPQRSAALRLAMLHRGCGVRGLGFLLSPAQQAFYSSAGTLNQLQNFQGGTSPSGGGSVTYNPLANSLETPEVSTTDLNGVQVSQFTQPQVTQSAAQQFAASLGGTVTVIATPWTSSTPAYGIRLPDGTVVDATAIANIIGNDAAFPSEAVKSGEIAKLIGAQYQPGIAAGLVTGTRVNVAPGPTPAVAVPFYSPTNQKADPAGAPRPSSSSSAPSSAPSSSWFAPAAPAGSVSHGGAPAADVTPGGGSWFTGSMFGGVPNWLLLAGAGGAALVFFGGDR